MAAQPLVREGYSDPVGTYATNVMGTVHILDCVRKSENTRSFVNITTDKVYRNNEWCWGYREDDSLDGYDPYSNSKSCSELVTATYKRAYMAEKAVSAVRSGNVIGGGDFAKDRIIPDCVRAMERSEPIIVRNPYSIRPYQHVLEALGVYLLIAEKQYGNNEKSGCYNVGPNDGDCITTGNLTALFCSAWGGEARWEDRSEPGAPHEANFLKLDCAKIKSMFKWQPTWDVSEAIKKTVEWEKERLYGTDIAGVTDKQIDGYFN
jgi:CDP-glucose 4,6-dehydratase